MDIKKKDGSMQEFDPSKILTRLRVQSKGLSVDFTAIAIQVQSLLYEGITSAEIDMESARIASSYIANHNDYNTLAARLVVSRLHKSLSSNWEERISNFVSSEVLEKQSMWKIPFDYESDYLLDYAGIQTFINLYGLKDEEMLIELPCEMYLRVALFLSDSKKECEELYHALCNKYLSLATPVLLNAGTNNSQMISCSLNMLQGDSLEGIHDTKREISKQSSRAAGIGLYAGNIRSRHTSYRNKGNAGGLTKFAQGINQDLRFFRQSATRRGAAAVYVDLWHRDVMEILNWRKQETTEELAARDLFPAVVMNDLFYKRLLDNENNKWSFFCPHLVQKEFDFTLYDCWGEEFEMRYAMCEESNIPRSEMTCKEIITELCDAQAKTGTPYMWNKDTVNRSYNQSNYGVSKASNLCIEIVNYFSPTRSGQCALASIPVMNCARDNGKLQKATALAVRVLNKLVDVNDYSTDAARLAGLEQRSLGIGIAGLQELALELDLPFTSREFLSVSNEVSELMYYAAVKESMLLAKEETLLLRDQVIRPEYHRKHPMIQETPLAKGVFHFELCGKKSEYVSETLWEELRKDILTYGIVNSLLIAHMPTASTSMLLACTEGSECLQELVQVRRTGSGEFLSINKYLQKDLEELEIWSKQLCEDIISKESLKDINFMQYFKSPSLGLEFEAEVEKFINRTNYLKTKYKTIWEISMKDYINLAAGRQPFIDQSQSMNLYYPEGILSKMISALVHGWKVGLKTGVYYTKVKPQTKADKKLSFNFVEKKEKPANSHYICDNCSV